MNSLVMYSRRTHAITKVIGTNTPQQYIFSISIHQSRHASSETSETPSEPSISPSKPSPRVNGPLSTLPPPLETPTREPNQALPKYLFRLGKSYINFYKTGLKAIYQNRKAVKALRQKAPGLDASSLESIRKHGVDRHDIQLLRRYAFDLKRVPMFALVVAIFGEFTPLFVLAVTGVVPYTCRIPKQINGDREKLERRRKISFRNLTSPLPAGVNEQNGKVVDGLGRMQLIHISWSLGLSSSAWDWLGGQFPGLPTEILRSKVRSRVQYLEIDDALIRESEGVDGMTFDEAKVAAVERGIDIVGRNEDDVKSNLEAWLKAKEVENVSTERLLLTR